MPTDQDKTIRKLRAILSADVKGYSLLMANDEAFTIKTLKAYRNIMSDLIKQYNGRVVDSPGDNVLAEFSSVVDAVTCATEVQKVLKVKNEDLPDEKRLEFRIGVNIGDVVQDGDRIYGNGVNVAARIEGLAEPGGVSISRNAYGQIKDKLTFGYEYIGEHEVKNIKDPIMVYKVLMDPADAGKLIGEEPIYMSKKNKNKKATAKRIAKAQHRKRQKRKPKLIKTKSKPEYKSLVHPMMAGVDASPGFRAISMTQAVMEYSKSIFDIKESEDNEDKGDNMKLKTFLEIPSWDWPEDVDRKILKVLRDNSVDESERLLAAELASDSTVINDDLAGELLAIVYEDKNSDSLRGRAAISLGPALEYAFIDGFEDPDDVPISENRFREIQKSLYNLYFDANIPEEVRRRVLEASVRAPQDWHQSAIQEAYSSVDKSWKLTAVFCMRFVRGFNEQVVVALDSEIPEIQYEAVCAAGNWEVDAAWSHIAALINSKDTEKYLLLAAIEAVASIRPQEAAQILIDLTQSEDEDIAEAASEAIEMTEMLSDLKDDDISDEFLH